MPTDSDKTTVYKRGKKSWKSWPIEKKVLAGAGVVAGIGLGWWAVSSLWSKPAPKKPNLGLTTRAQCSSHVITDEIVLRNKLRESINFATKGNQAPDPLALTAKFLTQKSLACVSYPNATRNPGEAELFFKVFKMVMSIMQDQNMVSVAQRQTFEEMAATWATGNGAVIDFYPEEPDGIPDDMPPMS